MAKLEIPRPASTAEKNEMPNFRKPASSKKMTNKQPQRKELKRQPQLTPDYAEYLERYGEFGEGRPRLSPEEFDRLDDELLELLDLSGNELSDEQIVRIQELEYLLIDTE